jgi:DNA-binding MarR family transcriptional regulator
VRLRTAAQATDMGRTFAMPTACTSQQEIERALHVLSSRESQDQLYRRLAACVGVDLDPLSIWLLFRFREQAPIAGATLAKRFHVPAAMLLPSLEALRESGLITTTAPVEDQADGQLQLTAAGQETVTTLVSACQERLAELLDGWSPEQEAELAALLHWLTTILLSEGRAEERVDQHSGLEPAEFIEEKREA